MAGVDPKLRNLIFLPLVSGTQEGTGLKPIYCSKACKG